MSKKTIGKIYVGHSFPRFPRSLKGQKSDGSDYITVFIPQPKKPPL